MTNEQIKQWFIENKRLYFSSIELTQRCNFTCKHCYCTDKNCQFLSLDMCKIILDKLYNSGCLFLTLTGGEILTHPNFLEIYIYAKDKGFIVDLMTNGSLINNNVISLFKKLPPRNIAITLYGTNEKEYFQFTGNERNFSNVMNGLYLLKNNNIDFSLRTIATQCFYDSLKKGKFDEIASSFGVPFRFDPIVFPALSGDKSPLTESLTPHQIACLEFDNNLRHTAWRKILNDNSEYKWGCNAGDSSLAIDYKGNAYLCGLYRHNPISIVYEDIETVLSHLRRLHKQHIEIIENNECSSCKLRKICKWCPAYSSVYNGNLTKKIDFFCTLSEERVKAFET